MSNTTLGYGSKPNASPNVAVPGTALALAPPGDRHVFIACYRSQFDLGVEISPALYNGFETPRKSPNLLSTVHFVFLSNGEIFFFAHASFH
jgi:hypothetical protein